MTCLDMLRPCLCILMLFAFKTNLQADPLVRYTPLSDTAHRSGQLDLYENVPETTGEVRLGDYVLTYRIPKSARAYDVVPIHYKLHQPGNARRAVVEAVASEDAQKAQGRPLYDLVVPGDLKVNIEYLGSVCANYEPEKHAFLTSDPKSPISSYPNIARDPFVRSSTIRAADINWFQFRITNTGDTILSPEGLAATFFYPEITRLDENGQPLWTAKTQNLYVRHLGYIYPGESVEVWVNFYCAPHLAWPGLGLTEGNYRIDFMALYRYHQHYDWGINIWHGKDFAKLSFPIRVTKDGGQTPVEPAMQITDASDKTPGYFDTFEEFMTTFKFYPPAENANDLEGTLYLQLAPWTDHVALKLIATDPKELALARVPITVSQETLDIAYNPKNVMVLDNEGQEEPIIAAQALPAMRTNAQLGPYPEKHMLADIQEMKDLGINVIATSNGGWWAPEVNGRRTYDMCAASYKYWYDVLVRQMGLKTFGRSVYPPYDLAWFDWAESLLGHKVEYSKASSTYQGQEGVDMGDPNVPVVFAAWIKYCYGRWGDTWFKTKDGRMPIDIEDSLGWMRDDLNVRHRTGPKAIAKFRTWLKEKYGTIEQLNAAWNSKFDNFEAIDPEAHYAQEPADLGNKEFYNSQDPIFHDWTPAMEDWDRFRTWLRMDIYRQVNAIIKAEIPNAEIALRTEGANLVVPGNPKSTDMHDRHAYFAQRRGGLVFDVVQQENVLHFYGDYTTLPYPLDIWRRSMREMTAAGIVPIFLPQFNDMRDILLNPHYGRDYQVSYGLAAPMKGMMIHSLQAAYPYWKAAYEEGGAPCMSWADYLCDGFVTETQKREIKLLREHFQTMKR